MPEKESGRPDTGNGKSNKIRTLYLLPKAVAHLRRYLAEFHGETPVPEAYVFYSRNTGCYGKLPQPAISKMLKKYAKALATLEDENEVRHTDIALAFR